jgi:hypothetical protein
MEPEDSLPCSKEPSTGPYPEIDQLSPYHPILSDSIGFLYDVFLTKMRKWQVSNIGFIWILYVST